MHIKRLLCVTCVGLALGVPIAGHAQESTSAMAAPKCDLATMEKLCAENSKECVKVEKGAFEGGYNVTTKDKQAESRFLTEVVIKSCM
jgi:hypothetical protein